LRFYLAMVTLFIILNLQLQILPFILLFISLIKGLETFFLLAVI
jgi:hypothetical protein